jgi:hypothetical protein
MEKVFGLWPEKYFELFTIQLPNPTRRQKSKWRSKTTFAFFEHLNIRLPYKIFAQNYLSSLSWIVLRARKSIRIVIQMLHYSARNAFILATYGI